MATKKLVVHTPQGEAGDLYKEARFAFRYTTEQRNRELSLTMPLRAADYASTTLSPVFESCIPEGHVRERLTKKLLKFGAVNEMVLLDAVGGNGIGRLRFSNPDKAAAKMVAPPSLKEIISGGNSSELFDHLLESYIASGISGVQPKALVPEKVQGTVVQPSYIVKATPDEYPFLAKNEFVCMEAARRAGLDVPEGFWLSDDGHLLVISRFDNLIKEGHIDQMGFEDLCQLMGKTSMGKYEGSYENVVKAIHIYCGTSAAESSRKFFGYLAASVLMKNGDAHLKNFGILYEHPRSSDRRLAPLYDVTTTSVYSIVGTGLRDQTMALKLNGDRRYPSSDALFRFGRDKCGVANPKEVVHQIAESMMNVAQEYRDLFDAAFCESMFSQWQHGLEQFGIKWTPPACRTVDTPRPRP